MKKFAPLLIATPRTGSTPICELLANIGRQTANYKNNLGEFFQVVKYSTPVPGEYILDNIVYDKFMYFDEPVLGLLGHRVEQSHQPVTTDGVIEKVKERIELLRENRHQYMMKIFPFNVNYQTLDWLHQTYDFVYLERKNKLEQLLSYQSARYHKKYHYVPEDLTTIDGFKFDPTHYNLFKSFLDEYKNIKSTFSGVTIYYEDLVDSLNEETLIKLLSLDLSVNRSTVLSTRKLTYTNKNLEELIINKDQWTKIREEVISYINTLF